MSVVRTRAIRAMLDGHDGILSFDVFDTLLWRRTPRPVEVFHDIPLAATRLGIKLPPISGAPVRDARRSAAESTARVRGRPRSSAPGGDARPDPRAARHRLSGGTLDDAALLEALAAAELAAEADCARRRPRAAAARATSRRTAGRRMVVVSDSYLSPATSARC